MSLAPAVDPLICGIEGKAPEVNEQCPLPGCVSLAQERHHLWSRAYLRGQPQNWVQLPSMAVACNVVGVCLRHHRDLTGGPGGHKGWIKLEHGDVFSYYEADGEGGWKPLGQLTPQPKIIGTEGASRRSRNAAAQAHLHLQPGETCDRCGYTKPVKRQPLPKRKAKTWGIQVPDDAEDGAAMLDDYVAQFAALLGIEDTTKGVTRWYVTFTVFAWAMQNRGTFIEDITEARMR